MYFFRSTPALLARFLLGERFFLPTPSSVRLLDCPPLVTGSLIFIRGETHQHEVSYKTIIRIHHRAKNSHSSNWRALMGLSSLLSNARWANFRTRITELAAKSKELQPGTLLLLAHEPAFSFPDVTAETEKKTSESGSLTRHRLSS